MDSNQYGKLYLVATPIGNLEDISYRAVRILSEVDLIAAEDTRNSRHLLQHFEIHTPMTSYHEFNKVDKAEKLLDMLLDGKNIAVITDAGTPGISDPGEELVAMALEAGITTLPIPGACACISAITVSGQSCRRFSFEAFLPKDKKELERVLSELERETRTIILYEAPHHLRKTLSLLADRLGDRSLTICRELTKRFEEVEKTSLYTAVEEFQTREPRGEYVLVIAGKSKQEAEEERLKAFEDMPIEEHFENYLAQGLDRKAAMKAVAKDRGISKRDVYQALL